MSCREKEVLRSESGSVIQSSVTLGTCLSSPGFCCLISELPYLKVSSAPQVPPIYCVFASLQASLVSLSSLSSTSPGLCLYCWGSTFRMTERDSV